MAVNQRLTRDDTEKSAVGRTAAAALLIALAGLLLLLEVLDLGYSASNCGDPVGGGYCGEVARDAVLLGGSAALSGLAAGWSLRPGHGRPVALLIGAGVLLLANLAYFAR